MNIELTTEQKQSLNEIAVWKPYSFPNGSSYCQQELPTGEHNGINILPATGCYIVTWPDGDKSFVPSGWTSVGPGSDLGAHFCTRDQALNAIR